MAAAAATGVKAVVTAVEVEASEGSKEVGTAVAVVRHNCFQPPLRNADILPGYQQQQPNGGGYAQGGQQGGW